MIQFDSLLNVHWDSVNVHESIETETKRNLFLIECWRLRMFILFENLIIAFAKFVNYDARCSFQQPEFHVEIQ